MALMSKPYKITFQLIGSYLNQLYQHPVRTKSISAAVIAFLGSYTSQRMLGSTINPEKLAAFGVYGLLFGGSIPHFFYQYLMKIVNEDNKYAPLQQLVIERVLFMPLYQFFSLYMLQRLEGKSHDESMRHAWRAYYPAVRANLTVLTLVQYVNFAYIPPMLQVFFSNIVGFFWVVYIANKLTKAAGRKK